MRAQKLERIKIEDYSLEILNVLESQQTISIIDSIGRLIYVNDNFCNLVEKPKKQLIGEANDILKSHLVADKVYKSLWSAINKGKSWQGVLYYKLNGLKDFWLETALYPINSNQGCQKFLVTYKDVTAYNKFQNSFDKVFSTENSSLKNIDDLILSVNNRAKIIRATDKELTRDYDEVVGFYIYDFIPKDYHKAVRSKIKEVFVDKISNDFQFENNPDKDANELYVSRINPVLDKYGDVSYANITTEHKTKNLKILKQLQDIETKYKSVLKSCDFGIIVITDSHGIIKEWNKGAKLAFGYTEKEVIGKSLKMLIAKDYLDDGIAELLKIKNASTSNKKGETTELVVQKKDGKQFPVELAIHNWYCGKDRYFSAVMLDVTKRKNLEKRLQEKSKDLELFLYRSAHDLKAPITSAEGLIELIKLENIDSDTKQLVEMLSTTLSQGKLLFDNLAFASSISQKKGELNIINFEKEVHKTLESLSGLDGYGDIDFNVSINQTKRFLTNRELLCSIFQNLIQNAIIYSKPLSAQFKPKVSIDIQQLSNKMQIVISDNGMGISDENKDKIFDIYYRASNEGKQGTGLGLYIVKCIVEDLNGSISVDTKLGSGTTFKILVPNQINNTK